MSIDVNAATKAAKECIETGIDPTEAIRKASEAMTELGNLFERGEIFLPEVMMAAEAMKAASKILVEKIPGRAEKVGKVVIGTVEGDVHDIGKGIVAAMLDAAGFEVIDIGRDVPVKVFIDKIKELQPDIVGASALLTVTRVVQKTIIDELKRLGMRDKVKVMVGGGATTDVWAREIGADAWGEDGPDAVRKAKALLGIEE